MKRIGICDARCWRDDCGFSFAVKVFSGVYCYDGSCAARDFFDPVMVFGFEMCKHETFHLGQTLALLVVKSFFAIRSMPECLYTYTKPSA